MTHPDVETLTWAELNAYLMMTEDEDALARLLAAERARAKPRGRYVARVHSRLNKVRADRERRELLP